MSEFKLPKKQVFIRAVAKNGPFAEALEKHGLRAFNDASVTLCADIDSYTKTVKTGLTEESQSYLEKKIGLNEGDLSPYPTEKFWQTYFIKLNQNSAEILNLEVPTDYLKYCVLKASDKVADSVDEVTPTTMFYIEDIEDTSEKIASKAETKLQAHDLFQKLTEEDRIRLLKIYGFSPEGNTPAFVKGKLFELMDGNPNQFIKIAGRSKERIVLEAFIFDLKSNGILREKAGSYFDKDTNLGGMEDLIEKFLNPKHQEEYEAYKERLDFIKR